MKALNLLILLFCFFSFQSCSLSQNTSHNKVEVLDLSLYKDWELLKEFNQEDFLYKKDDREVEILTFSNEIYLSEKDSSPFNLLKKYFPDTKILFYKGEFFRNEPIGSSYSYDREGNLIEEINHDEHFSFSIYDLINKIKEEYGTDLMISKDFRDVQRSYMKELDLYFYTVFLQGNPLYIVERILIDGNTGEIIIKKIIIKEIVDFQKV